MQKPQKLTVILGSLLFLSLAGNLFMGGLMIGKAYKAPSSRVEWEKRENMLRKKLSKEDRTLLKQEMSSHSKEFKEMKSVLDAARKNVEQAMNAEPFSQEALDAALRAEKERRMQLMTAMRQAKVEAMAKISPEGRQVMERLGKGRNWGMREDDKSKQP